MDSVDSIEFNFIETQTSILENKIVTASTNEKSLRCEFHFLTIICISKCCYSEDGDFPDVEFSVLKCTKRR